MSKLMSVLERLVITEDEIELRRPPVSLFLADYDSWALERRAHT